MALFASHGQQVHPAPRGNPRFDADVSLRDMHFRISLKNFGAPSREKEFENQSEVVREEILKATLANGMCWIGMLIEANEYPVRADWDILLGQVPALIRNRKGMLQVGNRWKVLLHDAPPGLDNSKLSSSILVVSPHHKNERKNFMDKIEMQCLDLNSAAADYGQDIFPIAMPPDTLSKQFAEVMRFVGIKGFRLHDLRHAFASINLQNGVNIKEVSTLLGHSSPALTLSTYARSMEGMGRVAVQALARSLLGSEKPTSSQ
jgi:hypothetical protein